VRDADVVLDTVGGETARDALHALRDGGLLVAIAAGRDVPALREATAGRVRIASIFVEPDRAGLEALAALAASGDLRPHVAATFPLGQAARAHELGEAGRTQGKLVLIP
jgi:NADPH:quinone reductase-like Zn-dependent oxidoreductase